MGVASLISGIISLIVGWIPVVGLFAYITIGYAIGLGYGCLKEKEDEKSKKQKVPAKIGLVIGIIALIVRIVAGIIEIMIFSNSFRC